MLTDFAPGRATHTISKPGIGKTPWGIKRVASKFRVEVEDVARQSGNDPEQACPAMLWFATDNELMLMRMILSSEPVDQLATIAYGIHMEELPPPEWVIYASESWSTDHDNPLDVPELEPGELHDRWKIGMTGVGEGIIISMHSRHGSAWQFIQRHKRVGPFTVEWGEGHLTDMKDMEAAYPDRETFGRVDRLLRTIVGKREWDGP